VVLDAHVTRLCLPHNALSGQIPGEKSSHLGDPFQIRLRFASDFAHSPSEKELEPPTRPITNCPTRTKLTAASFAALLLPATIPTKTTLCTDSVGFCKRLRYLRLDYNRLLGPVPSTIGGDAAHTGCKALEVLGLAGNMLEGRWSVAVAPRRACFVARDKWRETTGAGQLFASGLLGSGPAIIVPFVTDASVSSRHSARDCVRVRVRVRGFAGVPVVVVVSAWCARAPPVPVSCLLPRTHRRCHRRPCLLLALLLASCVGTRRRAGHIPESIVHCEKLQGVFLTNNRLTNIRRTKNIMREHFYGKLQISL
jgi:hypothetical protein